MDCCDSTDEGRKFYVPCLLISFVFFILFYSSFSSLYFGPYSVPFVLSAFRLSEEIYEREILLKFFDLCCCHLWVMFFVNKVWIWHFCGAQSHCLFLVEEFRVLNLFNLEFTRQNDLGLSLKWFGKLELLSWGWQNHVWGSRETLFRLTIFILGLIFNGVSWNIGFSFFMCNFLS